MVISMFDVALYSAIRGVVLLVKISDSVRLPLFLTLEQLFLRLRKK
ncbi:MAG: hypothetical protein IGNPGNKH_00512 [Sodalis sp. Ffu]|nr:MAG: hypothetical protein IGNPGNKH_00512 [Sodalis sp. Ffu]